MSERSTFLHGDQILRRTCEDLADARRRIHRLQSRSSDDRTLLFLDVVEREFKLLERRISQYADEAPEEVLTRFSQYAVEAHPEAVARIPEPATIGEVVRWIHGLDGRLTARFDDLASQAESTEVIDAFASLGDMVRAHHRRISASANQTFDM